MKSLPESVRNEVLQCIRKRYSKPIEPIRDENGNIALGRSDSTGGYYASPPPSPPGSQPMARTPSVLPHYGGLAPTASTAGFPLSRTYTAGGHSYSSGGPPLARTMTGGAYASISRLAREEPEEEFGSVAGGASGGGAYAMGGGAATPPGYDYGPSVPLPRTVDLAAVRLAEEGERRYEAAAAGGSLPKAADWGTVLTQAEKIHRQWQEEIGIPSGSKESGGGIHLVNHPGYEHINPALLSHAEALLNKAIEQNEKFGYTSKTNTMGLEAFHFMRDNGIEHYPPLYPKKKKVMAIISYTDLGY